jgi:hypothetical protein
MSKYGEPWTVYRCQFADEEPLAACGLNGTSYDLSRDECHHPLLLTNAARIVACVNACAGIEDPVAIIKELTAALENIVSQHERRYDPFELHFKWAREVLNRAVKVPS